MIKMIIELDGKKHEIDLDQAKKLQADLNQLFGEPQPTPYIPIYPYYPPYPIYPSYPGVTYPSVTYGESTNPNNDIIYTS